MVDRTVLIEKAEDCALNAYDTVQLLKTVAICFVIVSDILIEECKAGGAIDQMRYRKGK
jgi:hypothetical protein